MGTEGEAAADAHDHSEHNEPSTSRQSMVAKEERAKGGDTKRKSPSSRCSSRSKTTPTPPEATVPQEEKIPLRLSSPVGGEAFTFYWPLRESVGYSEGQEILDVVRSALSSFPELKCIVRRNFKARCGPDSELDLIDKRSFEQMSALLDVFNKTVPTITHLWKGATKPGGEIWSAERANPVLLKQICTRAYNRAVDNVHLLNNHYKAFSSETYGETSFERLQLIIQEIIPKERDVFVDLGSGVGQLVIHMAGGSRVKKAVGIEIAVLPNRYAQNLSVEFKKWMKWYGKKFRPFELHKGDFLDEQFRELITKEATIIFINNFAFTAELETRIKRELLVDLKDGTRIISTKPYGLTSRTITDRQLNDIAAILDVYEMSECENACSWTSNYVPYYHHTINRAKLEKYFLSQRNPALKVASNGSDNSRRSSTSSKASRDSLRCWSRESSVSLPVRASSPSRHAPTPTPARSRTPTALSRANAPPARNVERAHSHHSDDDDDEQARGPTTRRKWQEYCSTKSKADRSGQSAAAAVCNENDPGDAVTKWPTPDTDYIPPSAKKPRKTGAGRGRPRKVVPAAKVIPEETKETIELMHQMTCTVTARPASPLHDPALVLADLSSPTYSTVSSSATHPGLPPDVIQPSKYPAINQMLESLRTMYEAFFDLMTSDQFAEELKAEIEAQNELRATLQARVDNISKSVGQLLANGVIRLQSRLEELGIEAPTPALLLDNAKEIVAHHKKITAECAALESEITALDLSNQQLEMKVRRREESAGPGLVPCSTSSLLGPMYPTNSSLALAEKYQVLESHKNVLSRVAALTAKVESLPSGDGVHVAHDSVLSPQSDVSGGMPFPPSALGSVPTGQTILQPGNGPTVMAVGGLKRVRQRPARGGPSGKRLPPNASKVNSDPKEDEEMERKIKHIVAKALEVDSAAKCAEKERRARGDKRKEKSAIGSLVGSAVRRVDEVTLCGMMMPQTGVLPEGPLTSAVLAPASVYEGVPVMLPAATLADNPETDSARSDED